MYMRGREHSSFKKGSNLYHLCCGKVEILTSYPGIFFKYIFDLLNIFTKFKYLVAISNFKFFYDNLNTTNP